MSGMWLCRIQIARQRYVLQPIALPVRSTLPFRNLLTDWWNVIADRRHPNRQWRRDSRWAAASWWARRSWSSSRRARRTASPPLRSSSSTVYCRSFVVIGRLFLFLLFNSSYRWMLVRLRRSPDQVQWWPTEIDCSIVWSIGDCLVVWLFVSSKMRVVRLCLLFVFFLQRKSTSVVCILLVIFLIISQQEQ